MRFSIRDVLWLTVVVGLSVGWWVDHRRQEIVQLQSFELLVQALGTQTQKPQIPQAYGDISWTDFSIQMNARRSAMGSKSEIDAAIAKSAELGAPQPAPLPPGYGEKPNKD